jgi:hypothetical protein
MSRGADFGQRSGLRIIRNLYVVLKSDRMITSTYRAMDQSETTEEAEKEATALSCFYVDAVASSSSYVDATIGENCRSMIHHFQYIGNFINTIKS